MFNVYTFDKKHKEDFSSQKSSCRGKEDRESLTSKYKDRMNKTLIGLSQEVDSIKRHSRAQTAGTTQRSWLKSTGYLNDQERIQETVSKTKWLDTTPCQKQVFKLRPRDKSKEIQPSLKFKAKSGAERLQDNIKQQKEYLDTSCTPWGKTRNFCKDFDGNDKKVFKGGKEVLNYYHYKMHMKTIESLALDLHSSTRNFSRNEVKQKQAQEKLGMIEGRIKSKSVVEEVLCKEDVMPLSAELLEKLGLWEGKKNLDNQTKTKFVSPKVLVRYSPFRSN